MSISERLATIRTRVELACERSGRDPADVRIVGATKTVLPALIDEAAAAGLSDIGENYVQEALTKREAVVAAPDLTWHLIGHLQRNKVRDALAAFDVIQSVDSVRLAQALAERAESLLRVLLEVNVGGEASKSGFAPAEIDSALKSIAAIPRIEVIGLMTIAPPVDDPETVRPVFRELRHMAEANGLKELSMGMTDDFEVAIEEGATMIRIGRAIFGERPA